MFFLIFITVSSMEKLNEGKYIFNQSYLLCPYCYNEPPYKEIKKGMSCSLCPYEACCYSRPHHKVDKCSECEHGVLVLEPHWQTAGPAPKWKISCNNNKCVCVFVTCVLLVSTFTISPPNMK